jgi:hypothetical protein
MLLFEYSSFRTREDLRAKISALPEPTESRGELQHTAVDGKSLSAKKPGMIDSTPQPPKAIDEINQDTQSVIFDEKKARAELRRKRKEEERFRRDHGYGPNDTPEQIQAAEEQRRARRAYQAARREAEQARRNAQEAYEEAQRAQEFAQEAYSFAFQAETGGLSSPSEFRYHADNLRLSADSNASPELQSETQQLFDPYSAHTSSFRSEALSLSGNATEEAWQAEERARKAQELSREASQQADDAWNSWQSY